MSSSGPAGKRRRRTDTDYRTRTGKSNGESIGKSKPKFSEDLDGNCGQDERTSENG